MKRSSSIGKRVNIITTLGDIPKEFERSLFVFTISQCYEEVKNHLEGMAAHAVVFLPSPESQNKDPAEVLAWEEIAISLSDMILFWLPGSSTPAEVAYCSVVFGKWASSGKVIYGRASADLPEEDLRIFGYLDSLATREMLTKHSSAVDCIGDFLRKTQNGVARKDGERFVPLHVYNHVAFSKWYEGMKTVGNRLDGANFEWAFRVGPNKAFTLFWVLHVDIWVKAENRNKSNEIVLARADIKCVFPYYIPANITSEMDCEIVLIKEFRSPARTDDCFIHELPGGSAFKAKDPIQEAIDELRQETGLAIDARAPGSKDRVKDHGARQLAGTTSAHQAHLFSIELDKAEIEYCRKAAATKSMLGNAAETEQTYVEVLKLGDAIKSNLIDWTTLGMLHYVLHEAVQSKIAPVEDAKQGCDGCSIC